MERTYAAVVIFLRLLLPLLVMVNAPATDDDSFKLCTTV